MTQMKRSISTDYILLTVFSANPIQSVIIEINFAICVRKKNRERVCIYDGR